MNHLPTEILVLIVDDIVREDGYVTRAALKSLRLTFKRLSDIAAPHLFKTLPLWLSKQSLTNLEAASRHPKISNYINALMFSPIALTNAYIEADLMVNEEVGERFRRLRTLAPETDAREFARYVKAWNYYRHDATILSGKRAEDPAPALATLTRILRALPNLTGIKIDSDALYIGAAEINQRFGRTFGTEFQRTGAVTLKLFIQALAISKKPMSRLAVCTVPQPLDEAEDPEEVKTVLPPMELDFGWFDGRPAAFNFASALEQSFSSSLGEPELFSHLECLDLQDVELNNRDPNALQRLSNTLKKLLSINRNALQKLVLARVAHLLPYDQTFAIDEIIPADASFPNMRFLRLQYCTMTSVSLHRVLSGCAAMVETVVLDRCKGDDLIWADFLDIQRQNEYSQLRRFMVSPPEFKGVDVCDFLKGLSHVNPGVEIDKMYRRWQS